MLYAEQLNYWKTSRSDPDTWLERAVQELARAKARIDGSGYLVTGGRAVYMVAFTLEGHTFRISWPVLPSREQNERAARVQATTMLYHDIKARILAMRVQGALAAFGGYLLIAGGLTLAENGVAPLRAAGLLASGEGR
jgi:hypothetical protein